MRFAADLHVHSRWSRATSKSADLDGYYRWARIKGIGLLGTGDFTHPRWLAELSSRLVERDGLFELSDPPRNSALEGAAPADRNIRFILTTEISSIYRKGGATRKVHSLVGVPGLEAARRLAAKLAGIGNIASDGRPILGIDPKDLLAILLEISSDAFLIPAHIWTPWFSLFGSKSGFDRIEECFEDLTPQIFALETGLSSDVAMNRRWSALDRFRLVSCSDAHSPGNLGRETAIFDSALSYQGVLEALRTGKGFLGTFEFYPEEGKYHFDGHRHCGVRQDPEETLKRGEACPSCGKPITVGVLNRVLTLCDRSEPVLPRAREGWRCLVPLPELLAEVIGAGSGSRAVMQLYARLISAFGCEYAVLTHAPGEEIERGFGPMLAEAIKRMRDGRLTVVPGYDGEFGVVRVFAEGERERFAGQVDLFVAPGLKKARKGPGTRTAIPAGSRERAGTGAAAVSTLDEEQSAIVDSVSGVALVRAGPGAGKTRVLAHWIAHRIEEGSVRPNEVLAITFTNRAADEMRQRLLLILGGRAEHITIATFHAFCWTLLRERNPSLSLVYGPHDREALLRMLPTGEKLGRVARLSEELGRALEGIETPSPAVADVIPLYRDGLASSGAVDLSALVSDAVDLLRRESGFLSEVRARVRCIAVDELQDINREQYELLRLLIGGGSSGGPSVLCIGDPDQAIYGFRGSDRALFERLGEECGSRNYTLAPNYRSTATIVRASSALMSGGGVPTRAAGPPVRVFAATDPDAEASFIASTIEELVGGVDHVSADAVRDRAGGWTFADVAVLFRTRAVRGSLIPVFERVGLPFTLREESSLSERWPWRGVAAGLRLLSNPNDRAAMAELSGRSDARALVEHLMTDRQALLDRVGEDGIAPVLDELIEKLTRGPKDSEPTEGSTQTELALEADLFRETAREHGSDLSGFLRRLALSPVESEGAMRTEKVRLLTFHAAKGLEFPVVFLAGAEEGITPLASSTSTEDLEEERRLFYVAMTRCKDSLYISHCARRRIHGKALDQQPSRYLAELPADCVEDASPSRRARRRDEQLRLF